MAIGDVIVWRISKETPDYKATDLSGGAAKKVGGRWNTKGIAVVYASSTIALATLETLAHLGDNISIRNAFLVSITVPRLVWAARKTIAAASLPPTWVAEPPGSESIDFGDDWLSSNAGALMLVPSIIVPEEYNVLINPAHLSAAKITSKVTRQYLYDPRL
jgi:RES domain-containing protein